MDWLMYLLPVSSKVIKVIKSILEKYNVLKINRNYKLCYCWALGAQRFPCVLCKYDLPSACTGSPRKITQVLTVFVMVFLQGYGFCLLEIDHLHIIVIFSSTPFASFFIWHLEKDLWLKLLFYLNVKVFSLFALTLTFTRKSSIFALEN